MVGLGCVYIAYEYNSKSNTFLNGSIYGTTWSINSADYISDHHHSEIKNILNSIDYVASNYKEDSEVSIINAKSINTEIELSPDLIYLIRIADEVAIKTKNSYDITLGKISAMNGFSPTFGKELSIDMLDQSKYILQGNTLIKKIDFWFDMSSIAKGFAVQKLHEYLIDNNLTNHLIDIGGEIIVNGLNGDDAWVIGIQDPTSALEAPIYTITNSSINFLAMATSGEYRNFKYQDGKRVTHTINPSTNNSIVNTLDSVTVVSLSSSTLADAYATALNVIGLDEGLNFADNNNLAVLFIARTDEGTKLIKSQKWYDLGL